MNSGAWRVTVPVPRDLVKVVGRTRLKRALDTHSLAEAERRKHAVISEFLSYVDRVRNGCLPKTRDELQPIKLQVPQDTLARALDLREIVQATPEGSEERELEVLGVELLAEQIRGEPVGEDADRDTPIYDPARDAKAGEFLKVALGMETAVKTPLPRFHSEGSWTPRTKTDSERAVTYLEEWCRTEQVPFTVEALTRRRVGRFIGDLKSSTDRPLTNKTINKYLTCLSSYWKWMERRGYIDHGTNPWTGQFLPKEHPKEGEKERPFTDEEIQALLRGTPNQPYIRSLMMIGALTGARIDAIVSLKAKDITVDGCFRFKAQKRERSSRLVPIHSALAEVVAELTRGKAPDDDLFPECPPVPPGTPQERSMPAVKAFGYYRQKMGVSDKAEGKRRDLVNFHSFRRWFITKAYQAEQAQIAIDLIVGHRPQSVAGSVYLGGLSTEQLRSCVEAVRLPN